MDAAHLEELPEEIRSRVLAATANASHRRVRRSEPAEGTEDGPATYAVEAVSGDRVTLMRLSLRADGSVDETTDSFTARDVVDLDEDAGELSVQTAEGIRTLSVASDTAEAVRAIRT